MKLALRGKHLPPDGHRKGGRGTVVYLSPAEAAQLAGVSVQSIRTWMAAGKCETFETCENSANGKPVRVITLGSLPDAAQNRYWAERAAGGSSQSHPVLAGLPGAALPRQEPAPSSDIPEGKGLNPLVGPTHCQTELVPGQPPPGHIPITVDGVPDVAAMRSFGRTPQAETWERRMRAVAEVRARLQACPHGEKAAIWQAVAAEFQTRVRTLQRWAADAADYGAAALVPALSARGRRSIALSDELEHKISEAYLLNQQWTIAQVYRDVVTNHCRNNGRMLPHVSTVRRFIRRHIRPLDEVVFRGGFRAYRAHMEPKVTRELPAVNEIWCADHRLIDVMVLDGEKAVRPWVTAIADVGSAAWVGYRLCRTPSSDTVCHALRSAVLTFGVPRAFVRDNGKEFVARRLGGKPARLCKPGKGELEGQKRWPAAMPGQVESSSIWDQLGVQLTTALPYSAWSKPIESFFGAFSRRYENQVAGWTGQDAKKKPEKLAGEIKRGRLLTWEQFEVVFAALLDRWNTRHVCNPAKRDRPPLAYYEGYTARVPDAQTLGFLLQDRREQKVKPSGIELNGRHYMSEQLALYVGMTIKLAWDPAEPGAITVYTPDEQVLSVPRVPEAKWLEFGEANEIMKRGGRAQREYLMARKEQIGGACTLDELDPTGSGRLIAERKRQEALIQRELLELPPADAAAQAQAEAHEAAEQAAEQPRPHSPYREINEKWDKLAKKLRNVS